jgi:hypothetical protein
MFMALLCPEGAELLPGPPHLGVTRKRHGPGWVCARALAWRSAPRAGEAGFETRESVKLGADVLESSGQHQPGLTRPTGRNVLAANDPQHRRSRRRRGLLARQTGPVRTMQGLASRAFENRATTCPEEQGDGALPPAQRRARGVLRRSWQIIEDDQRLAPAAVLRTDSHVKLQVMGLDTGRIARQSPAQGQPQAVPDSTLPGAIARHLHR